MQHQRRVNVCTEQLTKVCKGFQGKQSLGVYLREGVQGVDQLQLGVTP